VRHLSTQAANQMSCGIPAGFFSRTPRRLRPPTNLSRDDEFATTRVFHRDSFKPLDQAARAREGVCGLLDVATAARRWRSQVDDGAEEGSDEEGSVGPACLTMKVSGRMCSNWQKHSGDRCPGRKHPTGRTHPVEHTEAFYRRVRRLDATTRNKACSDRNHHAVHGPSEF